MLWMLIRIHIPGSEIHIIDLNLIRFDIKWKVFFRLGDDLSVFILKDQLCLRVLDLQCSSKCRPVCPFSTAVDDDQLRFGELAHQHIAHIFQIHIQRFAIYRRINALDFPVFRIFLVHDLLKIPCTIVLNDNLRRVIRAFTIIKEIPVQLLPFLYFKEKHTIFIQITL